MKYRVTIKSGYNPSTGKTLLTNEQAAFSYIDYLAAMPKPNFRSPRSPWAAVSCSCTGIR